MPRRKRGEAAQTEPIPFQTLEQVLDEWRADLARRNVGTSAPGDELLSPPGETRDRNRRAGEQD